MRRPARFLAVLAGIVCLVPVAAAPQAQRAPATPAVSVQARVQRALTLLADGAEAEGEAILLQVVAEVPAHGTARLQLGRLALERGDLEVARRHLEVAVESDPQRLYLAWFLLGRTALALRDAEPALTAFEEALAAAPRFVPAELGGAEALIALGRPGAALDRLLEGPASPSGDAQASLLAAQLLVYLDRLEEARALLAPLARPAEATGQAPPGARALLLALDGAPESRAALGVLAGRNLSDAGVYLALGVRALREGDEQRAVTALEIGRAIDDTDPMPPLFLERLTGEPPPVAAADLALRNRFARAQTLYRGGRLAEAAEIASGIVEARPRHVPARLILLEDAKRRDDLFSVLAGFRMLLGWLPALPAFESELADVAHAMGAEPLARCAVEKALEAFPGDGALHYRLGTILAALGESEAAIGALERAIDSGFAEPAAWLSLGSQYMERMQVPEAIAAYREALQIDPAAAGAIGSFALAALSESPDESLRELLERHVAARPDDAETSYALGLAALREGETETAVAHLEAAAQRLADRQQVHYNLALAYGRSGEREAASAAMERFHELEARENERWEEHNRWHRMRLEAEEAMAAGRAERALELYRQLLASGGATIDDSIAAGRAALAAGAAQAAIELFETALRARPYSTDALEGSSEALRAIGETERAAEVAERLELLAPPCG